MGMDLALNASQESSSHKGSTGDDRSVLDLRGQRSKQQGVTHCRSDALYALDNELLVIRNVSTR